MSAPGPAPAFALVLLPAEAAALIPGWPADAWLVAAQEGVQRRWDAGFEADLPDIVAALPVWPPFRQFATAEVSADAEVLLIRHLCSLPGLAESARRRMAPRPAPPGPSGMQPGDLAWDE